MRKPLTLFLSLLVIYTAADAQKVKYKDLFGLLSTKQYEPAEPFLKKYLKENDDNPNAYLFMGIIFHEKALKMDVLKQTSLMIANIDSAILFYDKARKTIDEREVKRNKEYYQAYNRRDLRTGEFGVKLSDIQFDIEKKIESLRERTDKAKMVKYYFSLSDSLYRKCVALYASIQAPYPAQRQMFLRAEPELVKSLSVLAVRFDSCLKAFDNYKQASSSLGRTGYNQMISLTEIRDIKKDGLTPADFFAEDLKIWNYKKFATETKEVVEKDIFPVREHLITYDIEINKLRERLSKDSVSVKSDLTKLIDKLLYEQLKKHDPAPLPMEVFSLKTADLEYRSTLIEHKPTRDSTDLHYRIQQLTRELSSLKKLDSIAANLASEEIEQKAADYAYFITNTYGTPKVLQSYVSALKNYATTEKEARSRRLAEYTQALDWIVDGADSIPARSTAISKRYKPLQIAEEKFALGLDLKDTVNASGYFYTITPSRKPLVKVVFPVDKSSFKLSQLPRINSLTYADPTGQVYYVLIYSSKPVKEKFAGTLAKIYRTDGLAWSNNIALNFIPSELTFKKETGELMIKDNVKSLTVDKNGKILR